MGGTTGSSSERARGGRHAPPRHSRRPQCAQSGGRSAGSRPQCTRRTASLRLGPPSEALASAAELLGRIGAVPKARLCAGSHADDHSGAQLHDFQARARAGAFRARMMCRLWLPSLPAWQRPTRGSTHSSASSPRRDERRPQASLAPQLPRHLAYLARARHQRAAHDRTT